ncbi:MAG: hypothetical protein V3W19_08015, partial [Desulfatiglandales bacterium]
VQRSEVSRRSYDERDIRKILEPKRLWERVVSLDSKQLKKLLSDPEVDDDIKEKIRALEEVKKYYQLRFSEKKD